MSSLSHLAPKARAAYRSVLRASRVTFHGDPAREQALRTAVRQTFSSPSLTPPSAPFEGPVTAEEVEKRINEWNDVAMFLRRNVVQGQLDDSGSYKLRVTKDTELGDNASIRNPPKLPTTPFPNRNRRKCGE